MSDLSASAILPDAVRLHQAGRLAEAQSLYRRVVDAEPGNADALHLLGLVTWRLGDIVAGMALMGRAVARDPSHAAAQVNLANAVREAMGLALVHHHARRLDEAAAVYRGVLAAQPDHFEALHHLGMVLAEQGQRELAASMVEKALRLMRIPTPWLLPGRA